MSFRLLLQDGRALIGQGDSLEFAPAVDSIANIIESLRKSQIQLAEMSVDDIIGVIASAAHKWAKPDNPLQRAYGRDGLNFLLYWFSESHLKRATDLAMRGTRLHLDGFASADGKNRPLTAVPRGLICHWLAGNIPMLGMLSVVQGLIAKNANLVKVPTGYPDVIPNLFESISQTTYHRSDGTEVQGSTVSAAVAAVHCDSQDIRAQEELSSAADLRVAWGGLDAVEAVMNLPRTYGTEDVIFGPRTSLAVIGRESLSSEEIAVKVADKLAMDGSHFEQRGCNSPHTVFVERHGDVEPMRFAEFLGRSMARALVHLPRHAAAAAEALEVMRLRSEYEIRGHVYHSSGTEWTILYSDEDRGLAQPCFNRTLFVRPVDDIMDVVAFCSRETQTVGTALEESRRRVFALAVARRGVDRTPPIGAMMAYEAPWDGMFVADRMVRWLRY